MKLAFVVASLGKVAPHFYAQSQELWADCEPSGLVAQPYSTQQPKKRIIIDLWMSGRASF